VVLPYVSSGLFASKPLSEAFFGLLSTVDPIKMSPFLTKGASDETWTSVIGIFTSSFM